MSGADPIGAALRFDPLAEAERLTGHSYKGDEGTLNLGVAVALTHNERKNHLLEQSNDTHYGITLEGTRSVYADLGFKEVYVKPFPYRGKTETYVILWHPDGILATVESYMGDSLNSTKVYYNWRANVKGWSEYTSSGGMRDGVWVGDHDGREGLRYNLGHLAANGEFVTPWVERPFLWLLTHIDSDGDYDYAGINASVIAQLPEHVQVAIAGATS